MQLHAVVRQNTVVSSSFRYGAPEQQLTTSPGTRVQRGVTQLQTAPRDWQAGRRLEKQPGLGWEKTKELDSFQWWHLEGGYALLEVGYCYVV